MSPSRPCEKLAADTLLNRLQRCAPAKPHLYEHDLSDLKPDGESKTGREDGAVYLPKGLHLSNISGIARKKKRLGNWNRARITHTAERVCLQFFLPHRQSS